MRLVVLISVHLDICIIIRYYGTVIMDTIKNAYLTKCFDSCQILQVEMTQRIKIVSVDITIPDDTYNIYN